MRLRLRKNLRHLFTVFIFNFELVIFCWISSRVIIVQKNVDDVETLQVNNRNKNIVNLLQNKNKDGKISKWFYCV